MIPSIITEHAGHISPTFDPKMHLIWIDIQFNNLQEFNQINLDIYELQWTIEIEYQYLSFLHDYSTEDIFIGFQQ